MNKIRLTFVCVFCILFIITGCNSEEKPLAPEATETLIDQQSEQSELFVSPTPLIPTQTNNSKDLPEQITLSYSELDPAESHYPINLQAVKAMEIKAADVILKKTLPLDGIGNFIVYIKSNEATELFLGMPKLMDGPNSKETEQIYEIGEIGELVYLNEIQLSKSYLFGEFHIRAEGYCGANCGINQWFYFDYGVPVRSLMTQTHASEVDIDQDSIPEVILTPFTTHVQTIILKKFDQTIKYVDLNEALDLEEHQAVAYDANHYMFNVYLDQYTLTYQYAQKEDKLQLISDSRDTLIQSQLINKKTYDGTSTVPLQQGNTTIDGTWFSDSLSDFGLYLPPSIQPVKYEDGYTFESPDQHIIIQFDNRATNELPYLRKEDDLSNYSDYLGSEFYGDHNDIRYDFFTYIYDVEHSTVISMRYPAKDTDAIQPLLLSILSNIAFDPKM